MKPQPGHGSAGAQEAEKGGEDEARAAVTTEGNAVQIGFDVRHLWYAKFAMLLDQRGCTEL